MNIKKTAQIAALAGLMALPFGTAFGQNPSSKVKQEHYTTNEFFHNEATREQDKADLAEYLLSNPELMTHLYDFDGARIDRDGDKIQLYIGLKEIATFESLKHEILGDPNAPARLVDLVSGVTALEKEIDCMEKSKPEDNYRRVLTVEPSLGLTRSIGDVTDEKGNPIFDARYGALLSIGGRQWSVRPVVYADMPVLKNQTLEDNLDTYEHRTDSPFGTSYIITTREVKKQKDLTKSPILGAGLRVYPNKKKDLHLDFLAGFAPGQYTVTGSHTETDISKEKFDANGFYLQDENASLGTYDMGSTNQQFNVAELQLGVGSGHVAGYVIFQVQQPEAFGYIPDKAASPDYFLGGKLAVKFGVGKGKK